MLINARSNNRLYKCRSIEIGVFSRVTSKAQKDYINQVLQNWNKHDSVTEYHLNKDRTNVQFIIWTLTIVIYYVPEESMVCRSYRSTPLQTINLILLEWWIYTITENWRHGNINFDVHPQKAFNRRRQKVFYITVFSALNDRCSFEKYLTLKNRCSLILTLSNFGRIV